MTELDDSTLLHETDLMLAALRVAAVRPATLEDCIDHLRLLRKSAQIDDPLPEVEVRARLRAIRAKLHRAGLIAAEGAGRFQITARGRRVLADNPDGVDDTVLMRLPEGRFANGQADPAPPREGAQTVSQEPSTINYQRGYEAYLAGANLADNPHPPDVRACLDWENGWSQARDDHLKSPLREPDRRRPGATGARPESARASDRWR